QAGRDEGSQAKLRHQCHAVIFPEKSNFVITRNSRLTRKRSNRSLLATVARRLSSTFLRLALAINQPGAR
ncbi:hypothetical protein ACLFKT_33555, partial [Paraburkholderia sp. BR14261]